MTAGVPGVMSGSVIRMRRLDANEFMCFLGLSQRRMEIYCCKNSTDWRCCRAGPVACWNVWDAAGADIPAMPLGYSLPRRGDGKANTALSKFRQYRRQGFSGRK